MSGASYVPAPNSLEARVARLESRLVALRTDTERERGALADRVTAALAVESMHRERDMEDIRRAMREIAAGLDAARADIARCNEVLAVLLRAADERGWKATRAALAALKGVD